MTIFFSLLIAAHLLLTVIQILCLIFVIIESNRRKKTYNIDGRYCRHMEDSAVLSFNETV